MREMVCIVCPIGCMLNVDESGTPSNELSVTGNKCNRGIVYAREEIRAPKRTVTATCKINQHTHPQNNEEADSVRRVPVKTSSPCPKEKIPALLEDIYKIKITLPIKLGDIVIADWNGEGFNVIATRTLFPDKA